MKINHTGGSLILREQEKLSLMRFDPPTESEVLNTSGEKFSSTT